jgi:hypothetical protein
MSLIIRFGSTEKEKTDEDPLLEPLLGLSHEEEKQLDEILKTPASIWSQRFRHQARWKRIQGLQFFEIFTALCHLIQFLLIFFLSKAYSSKNKKDLVVPTNVNFSLWPPRDSSSKFFTAHTSHVGSVSVVSMVYSFFALSFIFQFTAVTLFWGPFARGLLNDYVQVARWYEYSISASLMGIIFAVLGNVQDVLFLQMLFVTLFATMILGLIQERVMSAYIKSKLNELAVYAAINKSLEKLRVDNPTLKQDANVDVLLSVRKTKKPEPPLLRVFGSHVLGWVTFMSWAFVLATKFYLTVTKSVQHPPAWVYGIYISQLLLFGSFGINQFVSQILLYRNARRLTPENKSAIVKRMQGIVIWAEVAYTVLSLSAKSVLAWLLFANALVESSIQYQ